MDGYVTIGTELDTKDFDRQIKLTEKKLEGLEEEYNALKKANPFEGQEKELEDLNKSIIKTKKELKSLNEQRKSLETFDVSKIGNGLENTIKKVTRWGLALLGIRSTFSAIRGAMSTLSQYNEDIEANVDYIRYLLASTLEPVIRRIIQLANTLLAYIRYIASAWFGLNLFNSAKYFEKMKQSSGGVANNVAKIKKQLAGFDEMNILQDDGSTASGGGGGGISLPTLTPLEDVPIPGWIDWIGKNADWVAEGIMLIATAVGVLTDKFSILQGLGIGIVIHEIFELIRDIKKYIEDPSWENFGSILKDIGGIVLGLGLVFGNLPMAILGAILMIVGYVIQNWDKIKEYLAPFADWTWNTILKPVLDFVGAFFDSVFSITRFASSIIVGIFTAMIEILKLPFVIAYDTVKGVFNGILTTIKGVFNVIKGLFTGDWKTVMNGFKQIFKGTFDTLWSIAKAPLNLIIGGINALIKGANKISFDVPDWVPGLGGKKFGFNIPTIPKLKAGGIINMPGRGVPVGGGMAIGGEVSREGVIPLTDKAAMAELGAEIGRNVILNLTNITKLDNRQIAREQKRINAENDFAYNR